MEPEELLRLKHITGFSKLFADREYNRSWVSKNQIVIALKAGRDPNGWLIEPEQKDPEHATV